MTKEDIKEYLEKNLKIEFTTHRDMDGSLKLTATLYLEDDEISEGWDYIYDR